MTETIKGYDVTANTSSIVASHPTTNPFSAPDPVRIHRPDGMQCTIHGRPNPRCRCRTHRRRYRIGIHSRGTRRNTSRNRTRDGGPSGMPCGVALSASRCSPYPASTPTAATSPTPDPNHDPSSNPVVATNTAHVSGQCDDRRCSNHRNPGGNVTPGRAPNLSGSFAVNTVPATKPAVVNGSRCTA